LLQGASKLRDGPPDTENFPKHKLCHVKQADTEGLFFEYYYAAERHHQDNYNFEFSQADLGGNQYDTVVRTYVNLRSDFSDTDGEYQAGDAMPAIPAYVFGDTYILMTRQQKRIGDSELDSLFVIEQRVYFKDEDKISFTTHPEFKDELSTTETLAHVGKTGIVTNAGTVTWSTAAAVAIANWGVTTDGSYDYAVQKLSNDWWKVIKQQLVGSNRLGASGNLLARRPYAMAKEEIHTHVTPVVGDVLFYVTVDRPSDAGDGTPAHPAYGTAYGTAPFASHKLCFVKQADPEGQYFNYYYAADRVSQDTYNFEFSQADLGGNKYDTVVRTYVRLRSSFNDRVTTATTDATLHHTDNPEAGDAMPDIPADQFDDAYILMTRQQKRIGDQELDGIFVVEQRVYFNRVDIVTHNLDPATDGMLAMVEKVVYRGETFDPPNGSPDTGNIEALAEQADDELWGLDDDGRNWEVEQLSNDWWKVTIQDVIPQGLSALYGGKVIRDYDTWQNFTWPAVVGSLTFTTANKKDGSSQTALTIRNKDGKDGFSGPTKMTVQQIWKKTNFDGTIPDPTIFKTVSATYSGVQFNAHVSNVLTEAITLTDFIGTKDPVYKLGEYAFPKPWCHASTPTDWATLADPFVGSATQKPFRGGYLLEVVSIHHPA